MRPYIDCHNHIGRTIDRIPNVGQTTMMSMARFAETNVYGAISMPTAVGNPITRGIEDIRHQNEVIGRAVRDFNDRFPIGLAVIEARFGKLGIEEADKAIGDFGLAGIVGHPPIQDWCIPFVEVAAARDGLCNLHLHNPLMEHIAKIFPNTQFIAHASDWAVDNLGKYDNVWFEVVQYPNARGTIWDFRWIENRIGRDRLIFGADLPYYDYRFLQRIIEEADIDEDFKDRIAWKNVNPLIEKYNPDWKMPDQPITAPRVYDPEILWACDPEKQDRLTVFA